MSAEMINPANEPALLCPKCGYQTLDKGDHAFCPECGIEWDHSDTVVEQRSLKIVYLILLGIFTHFSLITLPVFAVGFFNLGANAGEALTAILVAGVLGTPIWSFPLVWDSHSTWKKSPQAARVNNQIRFGVDLAARWLLFTVTFILLSFVYAIIAYALVTLFD